MPTATAATDDEPRPTDDVPQLGRRYLTNNEWREVKKRLEAAGVIDADAVEVRPFRRAAGKVLNGPGWWTPPEVAEEKRPLRKALPLIAEHDVNDVTPGYVTPSELAKKQTRAIERCNDLIDWLAWSSNYNRASLNGELSEFPELDDLALTARMYLNLLVAELERVRNGLKAATASRGHRENHIEFWKELTRVFDDHVSKDVKFRNQHKINFLRACSKPFFPKETTDSALSAFVESRRPRSSK